MPVIRIDMWEGRDEETKNKLIQNVSKVVADTINTSIDHCIVIITDVPKQNWGNAGKQASKL